MADDADAAALVVADGLMSVRDAARFVALSRSELYVLMDRGELTYAKIGRRRLVPRRALIQLAARNVVNPPEGRGGSDAR